MSMDITPQEAIKRLEQHYGSREAMLMRNLIFLSMSGQPTDVTFFRRKPILNVRVSGTLAVAEYYGLRKRIPRLMREIKFSNGAVAALNEIWTINPMPQGGFLQGELDAVDLAEGEQRTGPQGQTLREMIRDTYHCRNRAEVDHFLRRFIAS